MTKFKPQTKTQMLDVHNIELSTGKDISDNACYIFVKSLNNPLLRGKVIIGKDEDLLNETFDALDNKDKVYSFIEDNYKNFTAQNLSKIYADEKQVRDEERVKDAIEFMRQQEAEAAQAAEMEPEEEPEEEEPAEEDENEVIGRKNELLNDDKSFLAYFKAKSNK